MGYILKSNTNAVHQLSEGTGGVPTAPLLVELWQRREEVLEGAYAPGSRSGTAGSAFLAGTGPRGGGGRVWIGPVTHRAWAGVAVPQKPLPLLRE